MISKILNNRNEDRAYPFVSCNTVYPNGLISDISIMVDCSNVFIDSVTVDEGSVYILMSGKDSSRWYAYGDRGSSTPLQILDSRSSKPVGWVSLGSMATHKAVYSQQVEICHSCIIPDISEEYEYPFNVNSNKYKATETLDIIISGDLEVFDGDDGTYEIKVMPSVDKSMYTLTDPNDTASITSINKIDSETGRLEITLPRVTPELSALGDSDSSSSASDSSSSASDSGSDSISSGRSAFDVFTVSCVEHETNVAKYLTITIKNIKYDSNKLNDALAGPFTCPESDILMDKIHINSSDVTPLSELISKYVPGVGTVCPECHEQTGA